MNQSFIWRLVLTLMILISGLGATEAASSTGIETHTSHSRALPQRLQTKPGSRITRDLSTLPSLIVTSGDPAFMQRAQRYRGIQAIILDPTRVLITGPQPTTGGFRSSRYTAT